MYAFALKMDKLRSKLLSKHSWYLEGREYISNDSMETENQA